MRGHDSSSRCSILCRVILLSMQTFYRQLVSEPYSRVNAHPWDRMDHYRWTPAMEQGPGAVRQSDWRKSSQFFSLIRPHAEVMLKDIEIFLNFEKHCKDGWDEAAKQWRYCYSDEHYLPTLLWLAGRHNETLPGSTGVAATDWSHGGAHPAEYLPEHVSPTLFKEKLRSAHDCGAGPKEQAEIQTAARASFLPLSMRTANRQHLCAAWRESPLKYQQPMNAACGMTARKFAGASAHAVLAVMLDCGSGLGIIDAEICATEAKSGTQS